MAAGVRLRRKCRRIAQQLEPLILDRVAEYRTLALRTLRPHYWRLLELEAVDAGTEAFAVTKTIELNA